MRTLPLYRTTQAFSPAFVAPKTKRLARSAPDAGNRSRNEPGTSSMPPLPLGPAGNCLQLAKWPSSAAPIPPAACPPTHGQHGKGKRKSSCRTTWPFCRVRNITAVLPVPARLPGHLPNQLLADHRRLPHTEGLSEEDQDAYSSMLDRQPGDLPDKLL